MQVFRRGKRLAVRLASRLLEQIGVKAGDQLPIVDTGQDPAAVEGAKKILLICGAFHFDHLSDKGS